MRRISPLMIAMLAVASLQVPMPTENPMRKCLLKSCDKLTRHNGGFCCAEHAKQYKEQAAGIINTKE